MKAVYERLYGGSEYRAFSPGETRIQDFLAHVKIAEDDTILDIGCGTARATKALEKTGAKVIGLDFVDARETDVEFRQHDLRRPLPVRGTRGFCCDVMEHIHPRDVRRVVTNIMAAVDTCYLQICTKPDHFGETVGQKLHLTVKPFWWWARQFAGRYIVRYAREERDHAIFVVSRHLTIREVATKIDLWETPEVLLSNMRENLAAGYAEAQPFQVQDTEVAILAGGPSLRLFEQERWTGPIITVNGAYTWAVERGYKPAAQIIVDPREWNKRFTQPVIPGCRFLISSQCHPEIARSVPKEQVWLWHSGEKCREALSEGQVVYPVFGGSTVMLRGLPLLLMLGLRKFQIWGFDSCLAGDEHHAYAQPENDYEGVLDVLVGGKRFRCHHWMAVQAQEFVDIVRFMLPEDVGMVIHGDGLIAHILKTGANYGGFSLASV